MTRPRFQQPPDAEFRQSQMLTGYGPGALIDLPDDSIIMGGIDFWGAPEQLEPVEEERLADFLRQEGQKKPLLRKPPTKDSGNRPPKWGVKAYPFPFWLLAQTTQPYEVNGRTYRTRPLVNRNELETNGRWKDPDKKQVGVVPVRFVRACEHGHIDDLDWHGFIGAKRNVRLWLDEGGAGNDFSDIFVRAEDNSVPRRALADINLPEKKPLGWCNARRPWLGRPADGARGPWDQDPNGCKMPFRLLTRAATNAYFSQTVSVISIPDGDQVVRRAVDVIYADFLETCESEDDVRHERKKARVKAALGDLQDDVVWREVERRQKNHPRLAKPIKGSEIETFLAQREGDGTGEPEDSFFARRHPLKNLPPLLDGKLERVVLVHRLREVVAQVGFTRFDAETVDIEGASTLDTQRAPLARDATWYPTIENRGEGVFLGFSTQAIQKWLADNTRVADRLKRFAAALNASRQERGLPGGAVVDLAQVMLHSVSHLLLTTVSLDCGYATSAIRERIYASPAGYGILLYTGAPGVEGTLGGLIEVGRRIDTYLVRALQNGVLCSNDPICSNHKPDEPAEKRWLHGAACHGCLLIAETSCERRNELLDRALVVPTLMEPELAFFGDPL